MKLWLGHIAPGTSDEELKEFVKSYAPELECRSIKREEGDGSRPGTTMEFAGGTTSDLDKLRLRVHGMHWKGRSLVCSTVVF
jgi:hypothetical protein